jgi:serine/threonine protein kinase
MREFYSEKDARDVVSILVNAIKFCHDKDIVHRDLKPENLLLASSDEDTNIKIADFGFATKSKSHDLTGYMGTRGYMAPEILEHKDYGKEVDMWSIGVITFILLCGYPPFGEDSAEEVRNADFNFLPKYWKNVSDDAKDFIKSLIVVDPDLRLTAKQALEHKWLMVDHEILSSNTLDSTLEELRNYQKIKKFRIAAKVASLVVLLLL